VLLANYLIGLREGLEATLVVSILTAFLVKTDRRDRLPLVGAGVAAAVFLSLVVGALLTYTRTSLLQTFESRELFGGVMSILAVAFVTWMIFWMKRTARSLKAELHHRLEHAIELGAVAVVVMAFLAVGREGIETAFIVFASLQGASSTTVPLIGVLLGIMSAVALGYLLYRSAVRINLARFFTWTGAGLVLVAGGILAYGFHDLQEAGVLGGLNSLAFDISAQVPPDSWYGVLLKGVFNFSPATTVIEGVAWLVYVIPVLTVFLWPNRGPAARPPAPAGAVPTPTAGSQRPAESSSHKPRIR
jgi:high-affinity iron transporter